MPPKLPPSPLPRLVRKKLIESSSADGSEPEPLLPAAEVSLPALPAAPAAAEPPEPALEPEGWLGLVLVAGVGESSSEQAAAARTRIRRDVKREKCMDKPPREWPRLTRL